MILIVEAPPNRTGPRVTLGAVARQEHAFLYFFETRLQICFAALVCGEQRDAALLFSCGRPVAWWLGGTFVVTFILRMSVVNCSAVSCRRLDYRLLLALGALPLPLPFKLLRRRFSLVLLQDVGSFVAFSLQVVGCFDVVWHRFVTQVLAASFVHLPRFLLGGACRVSCCLRFSVAPLIPFRPPSFMCWRTQIRWLKSWHVCGWPAWLV